MKKTEPESEKKMKKCRIKTGMRIVPMILHTVTGAQFFKDGNKVFTSQLWHSCLFMWIGIRNKNDIVDWNYASNREIYENKKQIYLDNIQELTQKIAQNEKELKDLEEWHERMA